MQISMAGSGWHVPDACPGKITVLPEKDDEMWLSKVQDPQPSGMCMCQPRAGTCQFLCALRAVRPVQTAMLGPPSKLLPCACEVVGTLLGSAVRKLCCTLPKAGSTLLLLVVAFFL